MGRGRLPGAALLAALSLIVGGCTLARLADPAPGVRGWTAVPTEPDPALAADAQRLCIDASLMDTFRDGFVIQDQRGPDAAAFMWAAGKQTLSCLVSRAEDGTTSAAARTSSATNIGPGGQLSTTDIACVAPTVVTGVVPAGTASLIVETQGGLDVTASLADGWFLAWWPGRADPVALRTETMIADLVGGLC